MKDLIFPTSWTRVSQIEFSEAIDGDDIQAVYINGKKFFVRGNLVIAKTIPGGRINCFLPA